MNTENLELMTEYQSKALESFRTLNDLHLNNTQWLMNQHIDMGNRIVKASIDNYQQLSQSKTAEELLKTSSNMTQTMLDEWNAFFKHASYQAEETGETLKTIFGDAAKLHSEYTENAIKPVMNQAEESTKNQSRNNKKAA